MSIITKFSPFPWLSTNLHFHWFLPLNESCNHLIRWEPLPKLIHWVTPVWFSWLLLIVIIWIVLFLDCLSLYVRLPSQFYVCLILGSLRFFICFHSSSVDLCKLLRWCRLCLLCFRLGFYFSLLRYVFNFTVILFWFRCRSRRMRYDSLCKLTHFVWLPKWWILKSIVEGIERCYWLNFTLFNSTFCEIFTDCFLGFFLVGTPNILSEVVPGIRILTYSEIKVLFQLFYGHVVFCLVWLEEFFFNLGLPSLSHDFIWSYSLH